MTPESCLKPERIADPDGKGGAEDAEPKGGFVPVRTPKQPKCQIGKGYRCRTKAEDAVNRHPQRDHARNGVGGSHRGRVIEPAVIVVMVGGLYDDLGVSVRLKGVNGIPDMGKVRLHRAGFSHEFPADIHPAGGGDLRQEKGKLPGTG